MCLAQGQNAVTPMRLEPVAPPSRVKHSTTEPLRSLFYVLNISLSDRRSKWYASPMCKIWPYAVGVESRVTKR